MKICAIYQAPFKQTALGFDPMADYQAVWVEADEGRDIDAVWTRFQRVDPETGPWPPEGYEGRSLSIGDVVNLRGVYYTPEPVGWRELNETEAGAVTRKTQEQVRRAFQ